MSPFAKFNFDTFIVLSNKTGELFVAAIAIISTILFIPLFYLFHDSLVKLFRSDMRILNNDVNNNIKAVEVFNVDIDNKSIIDVNNLANVNEHFGETKI